jgi:predicted DCC family thiol-disulfide oxidoreductase YuxK
MNLIRAIDRFFFDRIRATGFGLMRAAWGFIAGAFYLMQWKDIAYFYSEAGVFPHAIEKLYVRSDFRFTILDWIDQPAAVFCIYLILLVSLFCTMIGLWPRVMTIVSVLLMFSFHERDPFVLGGGDTVLRTVGFLLMISPNISAFSASRLNAQWKQWRKDKNLLPMPTMPIWPWRLLLWQLIIIYATSLWYKLLGTMWLNGTAVEAALHHPVFTRWPAHIINVLMPTIGFADYASLVFEAAWLLMLVPRWLSELMLPKVLHRIPLRRLLIFGGILFHGGIFLIMDAGVFSLAIFVAYLGLLRNRDFEWMKKIANVDASRRILVLYDGECGLCQRSVFGLRILDWLDRLRYADFRHPTVRKKEAPELTEETLDKAMHIKLPNGKFLTGFYAFRRIAWNLPACWIIAPFLYIPGVPFIGRCVYARVAASRKKCTHESCKI